MVQNRAFEAPNNSIPANFSQYKSLLPAAVSSDSHMFIRHCNFQGYATPINTDLDRSDSSFALVKGLGGKDKTTTFFSLNYPNYYLLPNVGIKKVYSAEGMTSLYIGHKDAYAWF